MKKSRREPERLARGLHPGCGFPVVGIGASAGGLEAFEQFFRALPADSGAAFIVVAHLDPTHVSILPELLQKSTAMPVRQIRDGTMLAPNEVYVIPPNRELSLLNGTLHLMELTRVRGANLPIDAFLRSLALDQGANAVAVILSGTGSDGTLGLKAVKAELGMVMVQDETSAKYDGMPRSAAATGLADYILPPAKMPEQLVRYTRHQARGLAGAEAPEGRTPEPLQKIFVLLRAKTGHDFSTYKRNTINRRIERRMNVHQIENLGDYARLLRESEHEADILFHELLIGVTNFFRDPEAFEALEREVLPRLLASRSAGETLRVWVPGCSSGEEAYSVAIALHEALERDGRHSIVQVFGTDIDADAVAVARAGLFPTGIAADVSPERLKRYFTKEEDGRYRIRKSIREMLVFAAQDVTRDPPFTKLDLLCCRNLLIYFGAELQKRLLPVFHYALKPGGVLFLGSSETVGQGTDLFAPLDKKWKIFERRTTSLARLATGLPAPKARPIPPESAPSRGMREAEELSALQVVETILQQSDAPPCAIVDDAGSIVYIHGRTGQFLELAEGKVTANLLEMARPGLKAELVAAVRKVARFQQEVVVRNLKVQHSGGSFAMDLTVRPVAGADVKRGLMMVVFETPVRSATSRRAPTKKTPSRRDERSATELRRELASTKESLQSTIEELETANEELKSTNEELQSTNEELQSTNEELETSKEELQSVNEEAVTVNAELQSRIGELTKLGDDMRNLLDSTEIATIFLDGALHVRRFTPAATQMVPLTAADVGRPIGHFASNLKGMRLDELARGVVADLACLEREVEAADGRWFRMRVRPYRTSANVIDGAVFTFEEITELRKAREAGVAR